MHCFFKNDMLFIQKLTLFAVMPMHALYNINIIFEHTVKVISIHRNNKSRYQNSSHFVLLWAEDGTQRMHYYSSSFVRYTR